MNLEFILWDAVINEPRSFGFDNITQADIELPEAKSKVCNCWIYVDEKLEEMANDLKDWNKKYVAKLNSDNKITTG
ncbi:MAG TPA: hypothetical protein VI603_09010 [Saprospiraceae bacterium]|nr:hypothetical protein [Saprospiraceae bacterium]